MIRTAMIKQLTLIICIVLTAGLPGCGANQKTPEAEASDYSYKLASVHPVAGRQGICTEGDYYWSAVRPA